MKDKDKDYLISAGILIFVGWFIVGIICYGIALSLCNKVEKQSTTRTILKIISFIGTSFCAYSILSPLCYELDIVYGTLNSIAFFGSLAIPIIICKITKNKKRR